MLTNRLCVGPGPPLVDMAGCPSSTRPLPMPDAHSPRPPPIPTTRPSTARHADAFASPKFANSLCERSSLSQPPHPLPTPQPRSPACGATRFAIPGANSGPSQKDGQGPMVESATAPAMRVRPTSGHISIARPNRGPTSGSAPMMADWDLALRLCGSATPAPSARTFIEVDRASR